MTNSKRAIVLLSGGLDSATCMAIAKDSGFEVHAISFRYGQRHQSYFLPAITTIPPAALMASV
ncbi:7-cyano-7-deazaguanine synthase [Rubripirellula amarantea]|nr:7-cyano-7-deazaguanine synthase [Rubripirellula amarantea]